MADALPLPKYHQIYLVLREQLHEGRFAQGLPGELALMQHFGVARVTVRRALQELAGEGLIARERGRGTRALAPGDARPTQRRDERLKTTRLTGLLENLVSTIGAFILATGVLVTAVNVVRSLRHGRRVGADPWTANTLEWFAPSPPPPHNFDVIPRVRSVEPMRDIRRQIAAGASAGE